MKSLGINNLLRLFPRVISDGHNVIVKTLFCSCGGVVGGAKVLGKLSVPERPTHLYNVFSRAWAYCAGRGRAA